MLQNKFQASEPSGSEEEEFDYFLCISMVQTQDSLGQDRFGPGATIWTNLVKTH